jgi:hypothetical protein
MANVLHRQSKLYLESVNTPDYMDGNWVINPDLSAVDGVDSQYWIIDENDVIREMTQVEKDEAYIEDAKNTKKEEINQYREVRLVGGFVFMGHIFDSDTRARQNISGMAAAIANGIMIPSNFVWRAKDNTYVSMDADDVKALGVAAMYFVNQCYGACWAHKDAVDALTTLDQVENYDYTVGWP